jgi:Clr5 domain
MADIPDQEPEAVVVTPSGRNASRSEWDLIRPLIKRLYVDEDKTLKEVMTIMAQDYGHHAT